MSDSLRPCGDWRMPGLPVHHQLPESTRTQVHWVSDAVQPSYLLSFPSPPALNLSQHQGLFKWVSSSQWPKYWSFTFNISPSNEYSGLISFRLDWLLFQICWHTECSTLRAASFRRPCRAWLMMLLSNASPFTTTRLYSVKRQRDKWGCIFWHSDFKSYIEAIYSFFSPSICWFSSVSKVILWTIFTNDQFSSVQSLSCVRLFATQWIAARQASLSITNSRISLRLMSIESVMPSSHLILCHPLLLLLPIPPSLRVFSNESILRMRWPKYWSFSLSISPSNQHPGLVSFRMDWLDLLAVQGTLKSLLQHHSSRASILQHSSFFIVQISHPYMTTGKTIALTRQTFVGKVISAF